MSEIAFTIPTAKEIAQELAPLLAPPSQERSPWYDIAKAAEYMGVSVRWLRERVKANEIEHHRDGRQDVFTREAMDKFWNRRWDGPHG